MAARNTILTRAFAGAIILPLALFAYPSTAAADPVIVDMGVTLPEACNMPGGASGTVRKPSGLFIGCDDVINEASNLHGQAQAKVVAACRDLGGTMVWGDTSFRPSMGECFNSGFPAYLLMHQMVTWGICSCPEPINIAGAQLGDEIEQISTPIEPGDLPSE